MRVFKHIVLLLVYGLVFSAFGVLSLYLVQQQNQPDLEIWHTTELEEEFRAASVDEVPDLEAYRQLESRLFQQLHQEIYAGEGAGDQRQFNRFNRGSLSDPERQPHNWNRTFELSVERPRGGVLLLHGLSDSPYSLRTLDELLHAEGFWVVGLRLPGHGTTPGGLVHARWEDFAAATRIAARSLHKRVGPDRPFYVVGYSVGAALAVEYSLGALQGEDLPAAHGLVLLSPAIGVSAVAALAVWQARLAELAGFEKLAWTTIYPEFDPYKYNSFPVNASDQAYELTQVIAKRLKALDSGSGVTGFPRILAFQSAVDATITPSALIDGLFRRLAPADHELVLFDINRHAEAEPLLVADPETLTQALLNDPRLPFAMTLVTNTSLETWEVSARHRPPFSPAVKDELLGLEWPRGVYSLSHVALPFTSDDPLYGTRTASRQDLHLGRIELRGEKGVLLLPADYLIRLRYNPFFPYLKRRVLEFLGSDTARRSAG